MDQTHSFTIVSTAVNMNDQNTIVLFYVSYLI